jgi:hypothetical protein
VVHPADVVLVVVVQSGREEQAPAEAPGAAGAVHARLGELVAEPEHDMGSQQRSSTASAANS